MKPEQEVGVVFFSRLLSPGNAGTGEISVETLHCKRGLTPLMEEEKNAKRESERHRGKMRVNRRAFTR